MTIVNSRAPVIASAAVSSQVRESDQADVAVLFNLLQALQGRIEGIDADSTSAVSSKDSSSVGGVSSYQKRMCDLVGFLSELKNTMAANGYDKIKANADIGQAFIKLAQFRADDAVKTMAEINKSQAKSETAATCSKIGEGVLGFAIAAMVFPVNPAMAGLIAGMTVLSISGVTEKAVEAIAEGIQKADPKMSSGDCKLLASAIVIVASVIVTAGASSAASAVTTGTRAAATVTTETVAAGTGARVVSTGAEATAQQSRSAWGTIKNIQANTFGKLPASVNLGITAGSMTAGSSGFGMYAAQRILQKKEGEADDAATIALGMAITFLLSLPAIASGAALSSGPATSQLAARVPQRVLNGIMEAGPHVILFSSLGQGAAGVSQGFIQLELAEHTEALGIIEAAVAQAQALNKMSSDRITSDTRALGGQLGAETEALAQFLSSIIRGSRAVTEALQK